MSGLKNFIYSTSSLLQLHKKAYGKLQNEGGIVVLCLHNISEKPSLLYPNMHPQTFEKFMDFLGRNFTFISTSELNSFQSNGKPGLLLTFDDGDKDFLKNALPVLKHHNAPAVQHVVVESVEDNKPFWSEQYNAMIMQIHELGMPLKLEFKDEVFRIDGNQTVSKANKLFFKLMQANRKERNEFLSRYQKHDVSGDYMNWEDLKHLAENNVEIGSHTITHDILSTIDDEEALANEISTSKKKIEKKLGVNVKSFAFPNGQYNENSLRLCRDAGYEFLFTTREEFYLGKADLIPRIALNSSNLNELIFRTHNLHNTLFHK